jgi:hypothetical protein
MRKKQTWYTSAMKWGQVDVKCAQDEEEVHENIIEEMNTEKTGRKETNTNKIGRIFTSRRD